MGSLLGLDIPIGPWQRGLAIWSIPQHIWVRVQRALHEEAWYESSQKNEQGCGGDVQAPH